MSNLTKHAEYELSLLGGKDCEMQQAINKNILEIVKIFSEEGHSGFSANYATNIINKLLRFEPITPLTGDESEWGEDFDGDGTRQNKRCSHVFIDKDGKAYDINGRVFVEPDGCSYTNKDSSVYITFPYTPKTEYINVEKGNDDE